MDRFYDIEVEIDGRKHRGQWALKQGCRVCVGGFYGSKTVDLGIDQTTIVVAGEVLRELVLAWQAERVAPAPRNERPPADNRPFQLTVIVAGEPFSGTWTLLGGEVFVSSAYGGRSALVKRTAPERVAERLMREIVKAWLAAR